MSTSLEWLEMDWAGRTVRIEHQWLAPSRAQPDRSPAPLMVFLHEGLGSVAMWKDFPQTLCDALGCRGLVYSRPGYGQSTPRAADELWAPDFMHRQALEVLPALLKALGVDATQQALWLFGHSDGASIALLYAAHFPALVKGTVLLAPHINVEDIAVQSIAQARAAYLATDWRQRLARYHADPDSAFWGWNRIWLDPAFKTWSIESDLPRITCPVLAVQGQEDEYGTMRQLDDLKRWVPQAQLLKLAACGHSPQRDQPALLIDSVTPFFRQFSPCLLPQHRSGDTP